jgi:hypothetical protein
MLLSSIHFVLIKVTRLLHNELIHGNDKLVQDQLGHFYTYYYYFYYYHYYLYHYHYYHYFITTSTTTDNGSCLSEIYQNIDIHVSIFKLCAVILIRGTVDIMSDFTNFFFISKRLKETVFLLLYSIKNN